MTPPPPPASNDTEGHAEAQAPTKADLKRANELRAHIAELASSLETIHEQIADAQDELTALNVDDEDGGDAGFEVDPAAQLRTDLDEARASHQRVLADFKNFQRRASENELRARDAGRAAVLESFVAVLDTFDMAMKMDPDNTPASSILEGVKMIRGEALRILSTSGFTTIEPARGTPYDPNRHEAVINEPAEDVEPGAVVTLHQPGYALGERVLRPAKVSVSPTEDA